MDYMLESNTLYHKIVYFNVDSQNELSDQCIISNGLNLEKSGLKHQNLVQVSQSNTHSKHRSGIENVVSNADHTISQALNEASSVLYPETSTQLPIPAKNFPRYPYFKY